MLSFYALFMVLKCGCPFFILVLKCGCPFFIFLSLSFFILFLSPPFFILSTSSTEPNTISDCDYLVLGFTREVGGTINPAVSITNIRLSMGGGEVLHEFPVSSINPSGVDGDPDADRRSNLFEYALGGDPNQKNDVGVLPNMNTAVDGIDFVYQRRRNAATRGIRYDIETTANLTLPNSWELVSLEEDGIDIVDAEFEKVTHRLDASGKAHEFIRLSIGEL